MLVFYIAIMYFSFIVIILSYLMCVCDNATLNN